MIPTPFSQREKGNYELKEKGRESLFSALRSIQGMSYIDLISSSSDDGLLMIAKMTAKYT